MKKLYILAVSLFTGVLSAQSYTPASEDVFLFSSGEKEVFKVVFDELTMNQAESAFKEYLKNYKAKVESVKGVSGEYLANDLLLSDVNQGSTNLIVKFTELEGDAGMYIHYLHDQQTVTSANTPDEVLAYKQFTERIADKAVFIAFEELIKAKKNLIKEKEKELNGLEKDELKANENIGKSRQSIKHSESTLTMLAGQLENQRNLLAAKTKQVNEKEVEIASVDVKALEAQIKEKEKENKSLVSDIEKAREEMAKITGDLAIENINLDNQRKSIQAQKDLLGTSDDKKMLKDIQSLEKEQAKLLTTIAEMEGTIANKDASILSMQGEMKANASQIAKIQGKITEHNEDALKEQLKLLEKDLKSFENDVDKTTKEISKENVNIANEEENIRQAEGEIVRLKDAQLNKKEEIKQANKALQDLESKQGEYK